MKKLLVLVVLSALVCGCHSYYRTVTHGDDVVEEEESVGFGASPGGGVVVATTGAVAMAVGPCKPGFYYDGYLCRHNRFYHTKYRPRNYDYDSPSERAYYGGGVYMGRHWRHGSRYYRPRPVVAPRPVHRKKVYKKPVPKPKPKPRPRPRTRPRRARPR